MSFVYLQTDVGASQIKVWILSVKASKHSAPYNPSIWLFGSLCLSKDELVYLLIGVTLQIKAWTTLEKGLKQSVRCNPLISIFARKWLLQDELLTCEQLRECNRSRFEGPWWKPENTQFFTIYLSQFLRVSEFCKMNLLTWKTGARKSQIKAWIISVKASKHSVPYNPSIWTLKSLWFFSN